MQGAYHESVSKHAVRKAPKKAPRRKKPAGWRSGLERRVAKFLSDEGIPFSYETEKLKYTVPEERRTYTPDFIVTTKTGRKLYIESKGNFDAASRKKMLLVIQQYPELDIRLLFQRNNKITKTSKTSYTMWCDARSIKYHVSALGHVPLSWLEE